jgi:hypothetical protein
MTGSHRSRNVSDGDRSRGFTTLELLIASVLLLVVTGGIASLVQPIGDSVERSLGRSDLVGGARAVLEQLGAELREAGSPAAVAIDRVRPARVAPAVVPLNDLDATSALNPGHAVRILRVPPLARQGTLIGAAAAGSVFIPMDETAACTATSPGCGFVSGMTALLHDETAAALVTVLDVVSPGTVRVTTPLPVAFNAGAVLAEVLVTSYGLRPEPDGSSRLVRERHGVDQPVIQQVVEFTIQTSGPDPLRVRAVDLRLRLEAPAHLRGASGALFKRAGTSSRARSLVPDVEWNARIALRQGEP